MKLDKLSSFALLGLAALSVGTAHATISTFTDRAAFLAQLQPGYFEDAFNDVANGGIQGSSTTRTGGGFSVTYTALPDGLYSTAGGISTNFADNNLVATLNGTNIYAVGGYFFLTDNAGNFQPYVGNSVTAFAANGIDPNAPLSASVNSATNFFGWISTTPITTVTVNGGGVSPNRWNTIDNFIVGGAATNAAVPEPGTLALLALGGVGLIRRQRAA